MVWTVMSWESVERPARLQSGQRCPASRVSGAVCKKQCTSTNITRLVVSDSPAPQEAAHPHVAGAAQACRLSPLAFRLQMLQEPIQFRVLEPSP